MDKKKWEAVKKMFWESPDKYGQAIEQIHELLESTFFEILRKNKNISQDLMALSYSEAFVFVIKEVEAKRINFIQIPVVFIQKIEELIFDKQIKRLLKKEKSDFMEIYRRCESVFKNAVETTGIATQLSVQTRATLFQQTFDGFKYSLSRKQYNNQSKTLQSLFIARFTDALNIYCLINNGNNDKNWNAFMGKLEKLKGRFLFKYKGLKDTDIHDTFIDSVMNLEKNIKQGRFNHQSGLKTYFSAIFNHKCIDRQRSMTTKQVGDTAFSEEGSGQISAPTAQRPDASFEQSDYINQLKNQFKSGIAELSNKCKELFAVAQKGLSNFAVAEELEDWTEDKVRTHKNICLNKLKEKLPFLKGSNADVLEAIILFHHNEL